MDFSKIKLLISDLDGTLTDGFYHIGSNDTVTKTFNTRDFWALQILQEQGIEVLIVTGATDNVLSMKVKNLPDSCKIRMDYMTGIENKVEAIEQYLRRHRYKWENVAFIGDGGNDLGCMRTAGITASPADALPMIKEEANYICTLGGGKGAVCEFVQYLLGKIKEHGN
jgi:3-deoxy-D-manno-octulosonate 8-phosphate phosphatase (KDO 8-P phosphatase)